MRTATECLHKAAEMERYARACADPAACASFQDVARSWRDVSRLAQLQDAPPPPA